VEVVGDPGAHISYSGLSSNVTDVEASHLTVRGLTFGPSEANIDAIKIRAGEGIRIEGCTFDRVGGISISANTDDTQGLQIIENTFIDLRATGIYLGCHEGECAASDYLIANNTIDGVTSAGVGYGMEMKVGSWGTVRDNSIWDTQGPGIEVYGSWNLDERTVVEGNIVVGSAQNAALEVGGGPALVRNNVVVGGRVAGLYAYDYGGRGLQRAVQLVGNTVVGEDGPAVVLSGWSGGRDLELVNNLAWQASGGGDPLPASADGATLEGNVACEADCFVDATALDLAPTAELASTGQPHPDLHTDLCGDVRPKLPTPGALEGAGPGPLPRGPKEPCGTTTSTPGGTDTGGVLDTATDPVDTGTPTTDSPNPETDGSTSEQPGEAKRNMDDRSSSDPGGCGCIAAPQHTPGWPLALLVVLAGRLRRGDRG
jgi:hypothetical protein